jgi:hypothetical protein
MLDQAAFQISIQVCPLTYRKKSDSNKLAASVGFDGGLRGCL